MPKQYKPGDRAPHSGVYTAHHANEHVQREFVTIIQGDVLPTCRDCGSAVRFQLHHAGVRIDAVPHFNPSAKGPVSRRRIAK